jgi:hypothetical protein
MVIALEVRNYRRALQFIDDLTKLNMKVTPQVYETLLNKARKHFPELNADARQLILRLKSEYKPLNEEMEKDMRAFVKRIREYIGEDKLEGALLGPRVPKPPRRISRKKARILNGVLDPKKLRQRWTSKHTNDLKTYEYVPEFERRLKKMKAGVEKEVQDEQIKVEIDEEIEAARKKFSDWKTIGFEGDFSLATSGRRARAQSGSPTEDEDMDAEEEPPIEAPRKPKSRQPRSGRSRRADDE